MSAKHRLIAQIADPAAVQAARAFAANAGRNEGLACVLFLWDLLHSAGIHLAPLNEVRQMVRDLRTAGFRLMPASTKPLQGDLWVSLGVGAEEDRIGAVAKHNALNDTFFLSLDRQPHDRPYRKTAGPAGGITYYLRLGGG